MFFKQTDIAQGALDQGFRSFGSWIAILGRQPFFDRTGIDTDSNGDPVQLAAATTRAIFRSAEITRIDANALGPVFHGGDRQPGVEMDIGDQRDGDLLPDADNARAAAMSGTATRMISQPACGARGFARPWHRHRRSGYRS